jgi:hypothetical protein
MKIETYISELLYRHECVIVPSLGGFITNHRSAQIHPVSHTFLPPSKTIRFNIKLQKSDGLLCNYIADCEGISFEDAQKKVAHFSNQIQNNLTHKKEAQINGVGLLTKETNGLISFEPKQSVNFLLDSFGLQEIQSPAILRTSKKLSIPNQVASKARNIHNKKAVINWKVAAVLLPLIGLISFFSYQQQDAVSDVYKNYAYLNPFKEKPLALYTPRTPKIALKENTSKPIVTTTKIEPIIGAILVDEAKEIQLKFHLIAGCFASEINAKNLVNNLINEGYKSSIIGQNNTGLYRVAFQSFTKKEGALTEMIKLKKFGKSTWLLSQK